MKTDNFTKVLLTSIVLLLGIIVVKDIDLPPKAHADILGNVQHYQTDCTSTQCVLLNTHSGMVKILDVESPDFNEDESFMYQQYGKESDF